MRLLRRVREPVRNGYLMRPEGLPKMQRLLAAVELGEPPVEKPELGPCWVWTGYCDQQGYARHREGRKLYRVHRTFFVLFGHKNQRVAFADACMVVLES
mgnify:CR=1 FL=1